MGFRVGQEVFVSVCCQINPGGNYEVYPAARLVISSDDEVTCMYIRRQDSGVLDFQSTHNVFDTVEEAWLRCMGVAEYMRTEGKNVIVLTMKQAQTAGKD